MKGSQIKTQDLVEFLGDWDTSETGAVNRDVLIARSFVALIERIDPLTMIIRDGFVGQNP